mmetsp:Transcript_49359/g.155235  ORF Transcript_49359/g.155235 Transcript_49359/m.155235 type:complete len:200 (-) Transcript_49359:1404-2003(-)
MPASTAIAAPGGQRRGLASHERLADAPDGQPPNRAALVSPEGGGEHNVAGPLTIGCPRGQHATGAFAACLRRGAADLRAAVLFLHVGRNAEASRVVSDSCDAPSHRAASGRGVQKLRVHDVQSEDHAAAAERVHHVRHRLHAANGVGAEGLPRIPRRARQSPRRRRGGAGPGQIPVGRAASVAGQGAAIYAADTGHEAS